MKEKIAKMYEQALYDDLPPNVFADQVLRLFDVSQQSELICRSYYPNNMSTGMQCLTCGKGKYEH